MDPVSVNPKSCNVFQQTLITPRAQIRNIKSSGLLEVAQHLQKVAEAFDKDATNAWHTTHVTKFQSREGVRFVIESRRGVTVVRLPDEEILIPD